MKDHIMINDGEYVPLERIKRIQEISEQERESLSNLGKHVRPERFNSRLDYSDGGKQYAPESVDDIAKQVAIVKLDEATYAPLNNIKRVKTISDHDRTRFGERTGRPMSDGFKTRIETSAGSMLSTSDGETIMRRMRSPYKRGYENNVSPRLMKSASQAEYVESAQAKTGQVHKVHAPDNAVAKLQKEKPRER